MNLFKELGKKFYPKHSCIEIQIPIGFKPEIPRLMFKKGVPDKIIINLEKND